jgi:hypothetical protein
MKLLPGYTQPVIYVQTRPRRLWAGWLVAVTIIAALLVAVSQIPVRTYFYETHYYTRPLIVWVIDNLYIVDPVGER